MDDGGPDDDGTLHDDGISPHQLDTISTTMRVLAPFSMLGGLFIVFSFWRFRPLRKFAFEQVLNVAVSDSMACISYMMGSPRDGSALCSLQAAMQQLFETASVCWTTVIAGTLYLAIIHGRDATPLRCRFYSYAW